MDEKETFLLTESLSKKRSKFSLTISKLSLGSLPNAKSLLASCLPVHLDDRIFKHTLSGEIQSLEAYLDDLLVGVALWGPILAAETTKDRKSRKYLYALAVLATERCTGIGSRLIMEVKKLLQPGEELELHVQESNEDAIRFYGKHEFMEEKKITNFYRRLSSSGAILMCYKRPDTPK